MHKVLSLILGGGKGTRLFPLTKERSKPAVPFGGKYRIVDIPISNCINADFRQIYILTQFNSASLHLHLARTYNFDSFSSGFCEILAAEQTFTHSGWYEGTADAVRKNLQHFRPHAPSHYLILSGDQLYRMDLRDMFRSHLESGARLSVACTPVDRESASAFGILKLDTSHRIQAFQEKPGMEQDISEWKVPPALGHGLPPGKEWLASMGIYIFDADLLEEALDNDFADFGGQIIPALLPRCQAKAFVFDGYWEDIGTVKSFYEANLALTELNPAFNFYDEASPIYTRMRNLPASKINNCQINQALCSDGCIITNSRISRSVVGIRTIIESGGDFEGVVCMGADSYQSAAEKAADAAIGRPRVGIGANTIIRNAIIDKNARIGEGCRIGVDQRDRPDGEYPTHFVIGGVVIIPKNSILPPGTVI